MIFGLSTVQLLSIVAVVFGKGVGVGGGMCVFYVSTTCSIIAITFARQDWKCHLKCSCLFYRKIRITLLESGYSSTVVLWSTGSINR